MISHVTSEPGEVIVGVLTLDAAVEAFGGELDSLENTQTQRTLNEPNLWMNINDTSYKLRPGDGTALLISYFQREVRNHLSLFQVGLSIQVGGLDVTDPPWVRGVQQQHVSRDDFITGQTDKVSDLHILPALLHVVLLPAVGQEEQKENRFRDQFSEAAVERSWGPEPSAAPT